jgi:hypothetical protein
MSELSLRGGRKRTLTKIDATQLQETARMRLHAGGRPAACSDCVSAWNKGSDSLLMQFWECLAH